MCSVAFAPLGIGNTSLAKHFWLFKHLLRRDRGYPAASVQWCIVASAMFCPSLISKDSGFVTIGFNVGNRHKCISWKRAIWYGIASCSYTCILQSSNVTKCQVTIGGVCRLSRDWQKMTWQQSWRRWSQDYWRWGFPGGSKDTNPFTHSVSHLTQHDISCATSQQPGCRF